MIENKTIPIHPVKILPLLAISCAVLCTWFYPQNACPEDEPLKITAAALSNWPPHYLINEQNAPSGFAVDIMNKVAEISGIEVHYKVYGDWTSAVKALESGQVDILPNFGITRERLQKFAFTTPYETFRISCFVRSTTIDINALADLTGRKVGVVETNQGLTLMRARGGSDLVVFNSAEQALLALLSGKVDAVVYPEQVFAGIAFHSGLEEKLKIIGPPLQEIKRGIALSKNEPALFEQLDQGVRQLVATPEYKQIYEKWYGNPEAFWSTRRVVMLMGMVLGLTVAGMLVWRYLSMLRLNNTLIETVRELEQAQAAIKESGERLQFILDGSQLGSWDWNIATGEVHRNARWAEMLGYSPEEIGSSVEQWIDLQHPEDREAAWRSVQDHLEGRSPAHKIEYRLRTKDGSYKWILDQAKIVRRDADGKPLRMSGTHTDITDRKKFEDQLRQTQKMEAVGTLAGGIAHDFNNMLGVILGNVSYAVTFFRPGEELFDILSDIQKGATRARNLTQQLLTFARGGAPIKKTAHLNPILVESAEFVTRGANVRCEFNLADGLSQVEIDAGQIHQAVGNLVINALQAMPEGGIIQISSENLHPDDETPNSLTPGPYAHIKIADQGVGIPEGHLTKIFDPFFTTKHKGSGLGLATTFSIIEKHSGHISVESELGRGTTFHIYLPASKTAAAVSEKAEDHDFRGRGKILIMDDQEDILMMMERMLNYMGFETAAATDGAQAVELYAKAHGAGSPFDLVILDLTVPAGMGGTKTVIELLKIDSNVKAIVSSGYSNDPIMANYRDYGFCGVIPKPFTTRQLTDVLKTVFKVEA